MTTRPRRGSGRGPAHPDHCVNPACGVGLVSKNRWKQGVRPEGVRPHGGRGYCAACYRRLGRYGTTEHQGYVAPKRRAGIIHRPLEEVLEDYLLIRDDVQNIREAAERMGMRFSALDRALYRARKNGDTRANAPVTQIDRAIRLGVPPAIVRTEEAS